MKTTKKLGSNPYKFKILDELRSNTKYKHTLKFYDRVHTGMCDLLAELFDGKKDTGFFQLKNEDFIKKFGNCPNSRDFIETHFLNKKIQGYCFRDEVGQAVLFDFNTYEVKPDILREVVKQMPQKYLLQRMGLINIKNSIFLQSSEGEEIMRKEEGKRGLYSNTPESEFNIKNNKLEAQNLGFSLFYYKSKEVGLKYTQDENGRSYHKLQNVNKELRSILFAGYWDYDIETCAPTILSQMYFKLFGEELPLVKDYCDRKTELRNYWANKTGARVKGIKAALTSIFFGGRLPSEKQIHRKTTIDHLIKYNMNFDNSVPIEWKINELLSFPQIIALGEDPLFMELSIEVAKATSRIAKHYKTKNKQITNMFGVTKEFKRYEVRKVCYHLFIGVERTMLELITSKIDAPKLLIHDGFISLVRIDVNLMSDYIFKEIGYRVKYSEKQL